MPSSKSTLALLGLFISGCAVGPDFQRPDSGLPATWSFSKRKAAPAANSADLVRWWRRFHDAELNSLVEQAVDSNLDVQQAAARLRQVRAQRQAAASSFWPSLDSESADARLAAAAAALDGTRLSMAAEVALTYCQLRSIQDQNAVARRNLITQQRSAEITHERRDAGFASDLDVANADALVANTKAQIPRLETAARQSANAIVVLLGRPPGQVPAMLSEVRPVPTTSSAIPTGIPSDLLRRRPDIRSAEANAHAATARIGVAVADLFPKFSLNGSLNQQSAKLSDWLSPSARVTSYGPSFNWALFQGGALQANIRMQQALRDEAVLAYRKTVLVALQEVEDAMIASSNERKRRAALTEAVSANRIAVELSVKLYTAGQTDFINVLNAQRSLLQSESEFTLSNLALATDLIALYKALGGGW
ncbi:MAG: efflux transporter outer membrane subunit [Verrucomicrobia bacterium]|nr:efflux transporter outer membrane subunit [Verrucomicrobiota bacterium]